MNGIVVMDFVQTVCPGEKNIYKGHCYGQYGRQNSVIRISRRPGGLLGSASSAAGRTSKAPGLSPAAAPHAVPEKSAVSGKSREFRESRDPVASMSFGVQPVSSVKSRSDFRIRAEEPASGRAEKKQKASSERAGSGALRVFLFALLFAGMLAGFRIMTRASSLPKPGSWKYYTTVMIPYGQTLEDIITEYYDSSFYSSPREYLEEICEINAIPGERGVMPELGAGTKIVIPYYSAEYK